MPVWQSIHEKLKGENLEIISAAQDTGGEAAAGKIFDAANVTHTAIIDTKHTISTLYNLVNVPSGVMIDEEGRVVRINEGTYAQKHRIGNFQFGTDDYLRMVRDWAEKGTESKYVWDAAKVAKKIRPRTSDEARAEAIFKLAVYFYERDKKDKANALWDQAQALHPDSWNFHRQDWSFLPARETNRNFMAKRRALTKPYYAPLDIEE